MINQFRRLQKNVILSKRFLIFDAQKNSSPIAAKLYGKYMRFATN